MPSARILFAVLMGLGATLFIDLWALLLKRAFGIRSLDYCLLGRWVLYMPGGTIAHKNIAATPGKARECAIGWTMHYLIGTGFALVFVFLASGNWIASPTPLPALAFGLVTVMLPFLTMQPAFGLGFAASKTPNPARARLKSITTHTMYGLGLYVWAVLLRELPLFG